MTELAGEGVGHSGWYKINGKWVHIVTQANGSFMQLWIDGKGAYGLDNEYAKHDVFRDLKEASDVRELYRTTRPTGLQL